MIEGYLLERQPLRARASCSSTARSARPSSTCRCSTGCATTRCPTPSWPRRSTRCARRSGSGRRQQLAAACGLEPSDVMWVSATNGTGIEQLRRTCSALLAMSDSVAPANRSAPGPYEQPTSTIHRSSEGKREESHEEAPDAGAGHRCWQSTLLGACGSDGGDSKASFSDQLQDECRTIARGLRDIDRPPDASSTTSSGAANDASKVYGDGLTALKKLKAPSDQVVGLQGPAGEHLRPGRPVRPDRHRRQEGRRGDGERRRSPA